MYSFEKKHSFAKKNSFAHRNDLQAHFKSTLIKLQMTNNKITQQPTNYALHSSPTEVLLADPMISILMKTNCHATNPTCKLIII